MLSEFDMAAVGRPDWPPQELILFPWKQCRDSLQFRTQMKVERPGKAAAVTPAVDIEGPMVLLQDGGFHRIDSMDEWNSIKDDVVSLWDSGEMLVGFGEFLENNKNLVPLLQ